MQHLSYLELEQEVSRTTSAFLTRNPLIGASVVADLKERLSAEDAAGVILVGLERLIWCDSEAFIWAVEQVIPDEVLQEIRRLSTATVGKQLVYRGFIPGQDFSVNSAGQLLLSDRAKQSVLGH